MTQSVVSGSAFDKDFKPPTTSDESPRGAESFPSGTHLRHHLYSDHDVLLKLDPDKQRVYVEPGDREALGTRIAEKVDAAITEHHLDLLKSLTFEHEMRRLQTWMYEQRGQNPDGDHCAAAYKALTDPVHWSDLAEAWYSGTDIERFTEVLNHYLRVAAHKFLGSIRQEKDTAVTVRTEDRTPRRPPPDQQPPLYES